MDATNGSEKPVILLDVMVENLLDLLKDRDWTVETVSDKLGVTSENRDDSKILDYADENSRVVITEDKKFIERLEGKGIDVFTIKDYEKANIIDGKLRERFG